MVKVYFLRDKEEIEVDIPEGFTLMEAAKQADIEEIPADCGGCNACGTCHVHVVTLDKCPPAEYDSLETELLEYQQGYDRITSRLSCQIQLTDKHNGLKVKLRNDELL